MEEEQFKNFREGMRCTSVVVAMGEGIKKKKSGDGRNKYLKERLPSQLHRAEMWKRQSKQARSLGWLGVLWRRQRERGREGEHEHETKRRDGARTGGGRRKRKERGGGEEGQREQQNEGMQNNRR